MSFLEKVLYNLPEVVKPTQKKLSFKEKLKWTLITLILFFILGMIPLFGLGSNALQRFEILSIILGAQFGSLMSLGIGPIVTASIVLQLLNGSGIIKFDLQSHEGRQKFQGIQKLLSIFFIIFEAAIYVYMGGLPAGRYYDPSINLFSEQPIPNAIPLSDSQVFTLDLLIIFQLFLGGILVMLMDEVVSKWGFGSGISLFIAAGVSQSIVIRSLSPLHPENNPDAFVGAIPEIFRQISLQAPTEAIVLASSIIATVLIFVIAVYAQSMKVEIPLSFGRIRGHGIRWPLHFVYTSNIPVILVSALFANIQLWARLLQNWGYPLLGTFGADGNTPQSGFVNWIFAPNVLELLLRGSLTWNVLLHAILFLLLLTIGCVIFSWFWVQTSGMDPKSQAKQIMSSGLQMPGFRRDERVLEKLLAKKINPLTILGSITVGLLSGLADISGALTNGTGLLLTVMIVYKLYEDIAKQHMMDMNPLVRQFMGGK